MWVDSVQKQNWCNIQELTWIYGSIINVVDRRWILLQRGHGLSSVSKLMIGLRYDDTLYQVWVMYKNGVEAVVGNLYIPFTLLSELMPLLCRYPRGPCHKRTCHAISLFLSFASTISRPRYLAPPVYREDLFFSCDKFYVEIEGNRHERKDCHSLYALLIYSEPYLLTTKAGTVAKRQPPPHKDPPAHFCCAQLVHYGLKPFETKEAAKKRLISLKRSLKI